MGLDRAGHGLRSLLPSPAHHLYRGTAGRLRHLRRRIPRAVPERGSSEESAYRRTGELQGALETIFSEAPQPGRPSEGFLLVLPPRIADHGDSPVRRVRAEEEAGGIEWNRRTSTPWRGSGPRGREVLPYSTGKRRMAAPGSRLNTCIRTEGLG